MIISQKAMTAALAELDMESLTTWGVGEVKAHYRAAARTAHPDGGGTPEKFAAVDRAKHVLLHWLAQQARAGGAPKLEAERCDHCLGNGYVVRKGQQGFKVTSLRVQCRKCRGTGELGVEHDEGET